MKILIVISMVVIFISAFFMFFIYHTVLKEHIVCILSAMKECSIKSTSSDLFLAVTMIGFFLVIDTVVIYILLKTLSSEHSEYIG